MHIELMEDIPAILKALLATGLTQAELARLINTAKRGSKGGVRADQAQISRWLKGQKPEGPAWARINEVARQKNVQARTLVHQGADIAPSVEQRDLLAVDFKTETIAPAANPRREEIMPDGEKIDIDQLDPDQAKVVRVILSSYHNVEVWRIRTAVIAAKHRPGTYLLVDLEAKPEADQIVLAEYHGTPIFRHFIRPYLMDLALDSADRAPPLHVDGYDSAVIKGVVKRAIPI